MHSDSGSPSDRPARARLLERIQHVVTSLRPADAAALEALVETDKRYAERHEPGPNVEARGSDTRDEGPRGRGAS